MRMLLAVEIDEAQFDYVRRQTHVPGEFLVPDRIMIEWGFRDPTQPFASAPIKRTGQVSYCSNGQELRVIAGDLASDVAARVVEILEGQGMVVAGRPGPRA